MMYDVIIIGGGLAGLTSAIQLSRQNFNILVIEKNAYPSHKVCGEYISNEVLPFLNDLEIFPKKLGATTINTLKISTPKGKLLKSKMPQGGFGISRYTFDHALVNKALANGTELVQDAVVGIDFEKDVFSVKTKSGTLYTSKLVQGAYGKRDKLDKTLKRKFIENKAPFVALKTHKLGEFPNDVVALHNFNGGYGGISKVENNRINFCYIVTFKAFKAHKDIQQFSKNVLCKNPHLKAFLTESTDVFEVPLAISQIDFSKKELIENHILMTGDAGGLIHPLCGNGMSMAIQSAQLVASLIPNYLNGSMNRNQLEYAYQKKWNMTFRKRLRVGRFLALIFRNQWLSNISFALLRIFPFLLAKIISKTHGKSIHN